MLGLKINKSFINEARFRECDFEDVAQEARKQEAKSLGQQEDGMHSSLALTSGVSNSS